MAWLIGENYRPYRHKVVFSTYISKNIPLLLTFSGTDLDFNNFLADGTDMIITESDGDTIMQFKILDFTKTPNNLCKLLILFDNITTSTCTFYIYFGGLSSYTNSALEYDSRFIFVSNMQEESGGLIIDESQYNHNATKKSLTEPALSNGVASFDGVDDYFTLAHSDGFDFETYTETASDEYPGWTIEFLLDSSNYPSSGYYPLFTKYGQIMVGILNGLLMVGVRTPTSGWSYMLTSGTSSRVYPGSNEIKYTILINNSGLGVGSIKLYEFNSLICSLNNVGTLKSSSENVYIGHNSIASAGWNSIVRASKNIDIYDNSSFYPDRNSTMSGGTKIWYLNYPEGNYTKRLVDIVQRRTNNTSITSQSSYTYGDSTETYNTNILLDDHDGNGTYTVKCTIQANLTNFPGKIKQLRISNICRTYNWVTAVNNNAYYAYNYTVPSTVYSVESNIDKMFFMHNF